MTEAKILLTDGLTINNGSGLYEGSLDVTVNVWYVPPPKIDFAILKLFQVDLSYS